MKIKDMAEWERPVEKLAVLGCDSMSDSELLALIIRSGTRDESALDVADRILRGSGCGLRGLADVEAEELMTCDGIGRTKASAIIAAVEIGRRIAKSEGIYRGRISSVNDVADIFMERLRYLKKEKFEIVILDSKGKIISIENISVGDLSSSPVHPRETFRTAVKRSGSAVILVHNHPSGDPEPSKEDLDITRRLVEAGNILGIAVLDHIVIGDGSFCSMKARGII